ncbi:WD40 repeat-like protein [Laetiporus sulphureus 93-53]|uniref:WD40 repeat-like protein n=1 Tax=Laetiporus sulphureus 93-53 TaxID=1314785 RepID=A0A165CR69_9APHY|nr:WD40 repeat-like protein [Laetiporus sulphureus 93-53]KZT03280.1 WD40 repeat-like protein [Laetiporus sulphureus 93-53]
MDEHGFSTPNRLCVTPQRKRLWTPASITNAYSAKRRRISTSFELGDEDVLEVENPAASHTTEADRFISAPNEHGVPLNITPRTQRIARIFGLIGDKRLKFSDSGSRASGSQDSMTMHRLQMLKVFAPSSRTSPLSAASHLATRNRTFVLALDGPGIPSDPFAFPLSWSKKNAIAVACGRDLYYQHLDTRMITHLGTLDRRSYGKLASIVWSQESPVLLAAGTSMGMVQIWDSPGQTVRRQWRCEEFNGVGGLDWNGDLLAAGTAHGDVYLFDTRMQDPVSKLTMHKGKVHGVRWSHDRKYLATGDQHGVVQIWDARAGEVLSDSHRKGGKWRHYAPVKALAWCPWKPDLLATGSTYPDGKIRIWSVKNSPTISPLHTIPLNTSVTSLIWSPHCRELLSTHGTSWTYRSASASAPALPAGATVLPTGVVATKLPCTNSITVHSYPSMKHVVSVQAHLAAVGHSCLSPDGTMVFTICPAEEAMKMWKVWGKPENAVKKESAFDKCSIR